RWRQLCPRTSSRHPLCRGTTCRARPPAVVAGLFDPRAFPPPPFVPPPPPLPPRPRRLPFAARGGGVAFFPSPLSRRGPPPPPRLRPPLPDCHPEPGRLPLANGGEGSAFSLSLM